MKSLVKNSLLRGWLLVVFLIVGNNKLLAQIENWNVNASDYEYSMTITAVLQYVNGAFSTDENDMIALFDQEGNCVGTAATSVYYAPLEANLAFVMLYSNVHSVVYNVKAFQSSTQTIYELGNLSFAANQELGSIDVPYIFSLSNQGLVLGCTSEMALNYNPSATQDDDSCIEVVYGCIDVEASNYNALANSNDNSCVYTVWGCTNMAYVEYNAEASDDDGSCQTLFADAYSQLSQTVQGLNENIESLNNLNDQLEDQLNIAVAMQYSTELALDSIILFYESMDDSLSALLHSIEVLQEEINNSTSAVDSINPSGCNNLISNSFAEGWHMIGYTGLEEIDTEIAFESISSNIIIVKDYLGAIYVPEFDFNGIGNLQPGLGYQIKLSHSIVDFEFP